MTQEQSNIERVRNELSTEKKIQFDRCKADLIAHPETEYKGSYEGVEWLICRAEFGWCGYWIGLTENQIKLIENDVHGGITGGADNSVGFDTDHYTDFSIPLVLTDPENYFPSVIGITSGTFKTYDWCLNHIQEMIDLIVK